MPASATLAGHKLFRGVVKLQFNILGREIWTLQLSHDDAKSFVPPDPVADATSKAAKWVSKYWMKAMMR